MKLFVTFVTFAIVVTLVVRDSSAQPAVATLAGRVIDAQSTPTPGAIVTVRSLATATTWNATSDGEGRFAFPMLSPGQYGVEVQLSGFAPWRADAVTLLVGQDQVLSVQLRVGGVQEAVVVRGDTRPLTTAVDGVLSAARIESLPLNGRNFLELALLVPGNNPTPLFDPTKTNSVLIASAGQMGRGGNITIDGQDNNDDVVGGPLMNLPIDAVQEFQIATNRFGADLGRSASSAINVVTRSGTNTNRGTAAIFARDDSWQALPSTLDESDGTPPFGRQQMSGAFGGPIRPDRLFWFGAGEFRNQEGAVLVGTRNTATRTITRSFAPAPLHDGLWSLRLDSGGAASRFSVRYAGEWATDTAASSVERALGSATQRQDAMNRYNSLLGSWMSAPGSTFVNALHGSVSTFLNKTLPIAVAPQLTFPSLQDGASFRMPQETLQRRIQIADNATLVRGAHSVRLGGELQRIDGEFRLGVFQQGRIELIQDFPVADFTGDGVVNDNDLLFAVTLRSGKPDQSLIQPDADNTHVAGFVQDDWSVSNRLQLNLGLRYEIDTEVNNQSRVDELNPIVLPFVTGERRRDLNNVSPRFGFAWNVNDEGLLVRGGYGIYYDRIVLQIQSLERGLDGRALPIEVRAGNVFFLDPTTGRLPPFAPTVSNPFTGFILPGAGASGINIIDPHLQNPSVQEFHLGIETQVMGARLRVDGVHNRGTHFLIGRTVGEVFNPVVGGPDRVVNVESSARTKYDALLLSADRQLPGGHSLHVAYTLAKAFNYANDDQIPFLNGPIDPNDLGREYGPTPNDRRHRAVLSGQTMLPGRVNLAGLWTMSSGVPMDIIMPDGQSRVPVLQRNAGGRQFHTARDFNAFITQLNAGGGIEGVPLPLVSDTARFTDRFSSLDLRVSRVFAAGSRVRFEPMLEVFNLFSVTNILGISNVNYSGFSNVLVRDSEEPGTPGFLRSSGFGQPATTAGGVFGSGGPRAMQLAARVTF
ncbi:MAG TPA: TonB-dependent receptor [Vicinamibacterales bacterium]|nr:TonB-dependent receptor [Vicinamibacterales bacterium]